MNRPYKILGLVLALSGAVTAPVFDTLRKEPDIFSGPSTRSSIALFKCARVFALFAGRDYVIPDDIKHLLLLTVEHRIRIKPEAEMENVTSRMILERTLETIPVPKLAL
jgi:MoxR-like ATPase